MSPLPPLRTAPFPLGRPVVDAVTFGLSCDDVTVLQRVVSAQPVDLTTPVCRAQEVIHHLRSEAMAGRAGEMDG